MTLAYQLCCSRCERPTDGRGCVCESPQNPVVDYDLSALDADSFLGSLVRQDLWRYEALLPVSSEGAGNLQVGGTPLIDLGADEDGVRLRAKDETRNPSGSLKDRATEVALAVAKTQGHDTVVAASTGNAGASLACLSAAHGMRAKVVVPAAAPRAKLAQIRAYGAELIEVDGSYDEAFDAALELARREDAFCRNTGVNPYVREGKKTCALEIAEQLGWQVPDWVVVPCGDGNILSGIGAGFEQLAALGVAPRVPRLVAAQAQSSESIALTFEAAVEDGAIPCAPRPVTPESCADSISVALPRDHVGAIRALLACDGFPVVVSDEAILAARRRLAEGFGLWVEPAAAASLAAVRALQAQGTISAGDSVVMVLTGAGLKDPEV